MTTSARGISTNTVAITSKLFWLMDFYNDPELLLEAYEYALGGQRQPVVVLTAGAADMRLLDRVASPLIERYGEAVRFHIHCTNVKEVVETLACCWMFWPRTKVARKWLQ